MPKKRTSTKPSAKKRTANSKRSAKRPRASTRKKGGSRRAKSPKAGSRRGPISRIRVAGEKTWKVLKSTTAHVVDEVKETFSGDEGPRSR